jgi:hypothetical protein
VSRGTSCETLLAPILVTVALLVGNVSPAVADLDLSRVVWDFGSIEQGETKAQKIVMTNSGDQTLTIEKIELPEGFSIKPSLDNTEIQPKQDFEIELTVDSTAILGQIQQYAYIFSTSADRKQIVPLTIKGEVLEKGQPRLRISPETWDFRTIKVGDTQTRVFTCENVGTADLKIETIQIYDTRFRVERNITRSIIEPGGKSDFTVSVSGRYQGSYDTDFYVQSNSAGRKFTKVTIKGYVVEKPSGLVIASNLSSVTNNTLSTFEVVRTDKEGKTDTITVLKDSTSRFPQEPGTPPTRIDPADYTVTIKLVKPTLPATEPPETKPSGEKPETPAPKPEAEPVKEQTAGETTPPAETGAAKPEETQPPEEIKKEEEKKPEQPEEKKEPESPPPSQKEQPEKPAEKAPPKPEEPKPPEEKAPAPSTEPAKSPDSEKPPETPPGEAPGPAQ